jgi:formyl-CoA transferase
MAPGGMYACAPGGANDYVYLSIVTSRMWESLCAALGKPELAQDARFATSQARAQHTQELRQEITEWTSQRDKHAAMKQLAQAGVPASAVFDTADIFKDRHLNERGFFQNVDHPVAGRLRLMGSPLHMSRSEARLEPAPLLGQHSQEVLRAELGLTDAELSELIQSGVIGIGRRSD